MFEQLTSAALFPFHASQTLSMVGVEEGNVDSCKFVRGRGVGTGGYIGIYTPKSVYLKFFYVAVLSPFVIYTLTLP